MKQSTKAHLALLGANFFYGAGFTVAKHIMPRLLQPAAFIFLRVAISTLLFWGSYLLAKEWRTGIKKEHWWRLVMGGIFGVAVNQLLFFEGLNLTFPIHASLMMMSTPLLITLFASILLRERISWDKSLGLVIGISGAILLMSAGKEITQNGTSSKGDFLIFLNAASYAIYLVTIKPLMKLYRPLIVIRSVFLIGGICVIPFAWSSLPLIHWQAFNTTDYACLTFIIICCTFFTYLWNAYALQILSPSTAGAYIYLQPFFAAAIAMVFLGEGFTIIKAAATLLIFSGVYLVNFGFKKYAR